MFLTQERNLKTHRASALFNLLPPIQRLEKLITYALIAGLILLTAGLGIGGVFLELPEGTSFWRDSKVVWSLLVWLFYAALLLAHAGNSTNAGAGTPGWRSSRFVLSSSLFGAPTFCPVFIIPPSKSCPLLSQV